MSILLSATFETRREAEMTVERLVQEFGLDRATIFVGPEQDENSAGVGPNGSDLPDAREDTATTDQAELRGAIVVSVKVEDKATAANVRDAFSEFDAAGVVESDPALD